MAQADILRFLRSNNPFVSVQQAGTNAETRTMDDAALNKAIQELGSPQAVFQRYFAGNGRGMSLSPDGQTVTYNSDKENNSWEDWGGGLAIPLAFAGMAAGAGALSGALGGAAAGTAGTGAAYGSIPELGLIANPATANAAIAAGIPASTLSGGAGALTLGGTTGSISGGSDTMQSLWQAGQNAPTSTAGGEIPWGVNQAGGSMPYGDAIEGLIDLTNQGLTGEQAIAALGEINPAWTQTGLEFLMNNPSQLFSSVTTPLKSLLGSGSGSGSGDTDWTSFLGKLGAAGLGAYASNEQSKSLSDLANKYSEYGAPSRARFEQSMTPGFDPNSIPGYSGALDTASKGILARLSATGGNPWGNPQGLIEANKSIVSGTALPAINEYQRLNLSAGGLGNLNAAVPALQQGAIGQDANMWNSLGYGLNAATAPKQQSLADLYKSLGIGGLA